MKELSIEEKAKAYDEAIERGKQIQNTPYTAHWDIMKEVAEHLLPELKESEDEKIRNWLISTLKSLNSTAVHIDGAYEMMLPAIAWLEKQGEQKPIVIIPKFRVGDEIKTSNEESLTITKIDEKGYWSEDLFICDFDEECLWDLVEQKPAWSEEDEETLGWLCTFLKEYGHEFYGGNEENVIDWLKSLKERYTWKPSLAQMNALSIVSKGNAPDDIEAIVSLYNDLKKLREE